MRFSAGYLKEFKVFFSLVLWCYSQKKTDFTTNGFEKNPKKQYRRE